MLVKLFLFCLFKKKKIKMKTPGGECQFILYTSVDASATNKYT